jgi:hypothetical protein
MKDMQARLWREGDMMRTRLGNTLGTLGGEIDDVSASISGLSVDEKVTGRGVITGASSKPSRRGTAGGGAAVDDRSEGKEEDGEITQGDVLRQRRMVSHHMTPAEAKAAGASSGSKTVGAATAKASSASTRSHIGRLLGR